MIFFFYCLLLYSIFSISFSQEEQIHDFLHLLRIRSLSTDSAFFSSVEKCQPYLNNCQNHFSHNVTLKYIILIKLFVLESISKPIRNMHLLIGHVLIMLLCDKIKCYSP